MLTNSKEYKNVIDDAINKIDVIKKEREDEKYNELYGISINENELVKPHWYLFTIG